MNSYLLSLNLIVALISTAFGAVIRPVILSKASGQDPGEIFYSKMYAVRAIPFGLEVGSLPFVARGAVVTALLLLAALIQLLDGQSV